ncbi:hypothetical protein PAPHI01_1180 [Pancytospora philotis]|nr:hypothetical protein PAPHI01_1180 [Pancytospora philotis]
MQKGECALLGAEMALLGCCIYAVTDYSVNPKQFEVTHTYSDMPYMYFTNMSLYTTIATALVGFAARLASPAKRVFREMLLLATIFNSITVTVFWSLYFIKRDLIVNKDFLRPGYETYPLTEFSLHLAPMLLTLLAQLKVRLSRSKLHYLEFFVCVCLYAAIVHVGKYFRGKFVYPFLNGLPPAGIFLFFAAMFGICMLFYNLIMVVNHRIHGVKYVYE